MENSQEQQQTPPNLVLKWALRPLSDEEVKGLQHIINSSKADYPILKHFDIWLSQRSDITAKPAQGEEKSK